MAINNLSANGTIRELTRYIRPQELNEFRKPVRINRLSDKELCDTFYREDELYDPEMDDVTAYHQYSVDDIPYCDPNNILLRDLNNIIMQGDFQLESELPEHATILKTGKKVYIESIPAEISDGKKIYDYIEDGYDKNNVLNIVYASRNDFGIQWSFAEAGIKLLDQGYPLELILKYMDDATIHSSKGLTQKDENLLRFLAEFPEARNSVVNYDLDKNEVFDYRAAQKYHVFYEICNNPKDIPIIINKCRLRNNNREYLSNYALLNIAICILEKQHGEWSDDASKLLEKLIIGETKTSPIINRIYKMLEAGLSVEQVLKSYS